MAHDHAHGHHAARKLSLALALTVTFLFVEATVGILSGSLALLSDAGHMLTDAGALTVALVAQRLADRPRTRNHTFGFRRAEIVAALLNGAVLGVSAVWVIVEAVRRLTNPTPVHGAWMLATATVGLLINIVAALVLGSGEKHHNPNVRAAFAHVLADAAGSVAAMIGGILVTALGWLRADPVVSLVISVLILAGAWNLVRGSVAVLMEATPKDVRLDEIEATIRKVAGVADVHDLHVWSISEGFPILTVHVVLDREAHGADVARRASERIQSAHGIAHVTVQPEAPNGDFVDAARLVRRSS